MRRRQEWGCWSCELPQPAGTFQCERCYGCYACCLANGCIDGDAETAVRLPSRDWLASRKTIMRHCGCASLEVLLRSGTWFVLQVSTCPHCVPVPGVVSRDRHRDVETLDMFPPF